MAGEQPLPEASSSDEDSAASSGAANATATHAPTPKRWTRLISRLAITLLAQAATFDQGTVDYILRFAREHKEDERALLVFGVSSFFLGAPLVIWAGFWGVTNSTPNAITFLYIWTIHGHRASYFPALMVIVVVFIAAYVVAFAWVAVYLARRSRPIPVWGSAFVTFWLVVTLTSIFSLLYYDGGVLGEWGKDHLRHIDAVFVTFGLLTTAGTGRFSPHGWIATAAVTTQMILDAVIVTVVVSVVLNGLLKRRRLV